MRQHQREFTEFYQATRDDCLRVVLITVGDRQLAEDLVAEAFTRARRSWRTVRQHPAARAWVVRTALNTNISWWRRRRREIPVASPGDTAAAAPDPVLDDSLLTALRRLPARQRALAKAGVPAVVHWGEICEAIGPGVRAMDPGDSVQVAAGTPSSFSSTSWMTMDGNGNGTKDNLGWAWTIYPGGVPRGGHFVISGLPGPVPATEVQGLWEFARIGAPISCVAHMKA